VVGEPKRVYSSFVRGIEQLPVRIPGWAAAASASPRPSPRSAFNCRRQES